MVFLCLDVSGWKASAVLYRHQTIQGICRICRVGINHHKLLIHNVNTSIIEKNSSHDPSLQLLETSHSGSVGL